MPKNNEGWKGQFLKNWNDKGKCRVQNMGKGMINMLHIVGCKILKKAPYTYTSYNWHWYAATNLADAV